MLRIGVDVGGTFTDFAAVEEGRPIEEVATLKVPSTPPELSAGFRVGLDRLIRQMGATADDEAIVMHGTTSGVNTIIERSGPTIALLTTSGFKDVLELQRLRLSDTTNFFAGRPIPLVPRNLVYEIPERVSASGEVVEPIDLDCVLAAAKDAVDSGAEALAIAFLHSYRNPDHERIAGEHIRSCLGDVPVSISSELWPQIGEYERAVVATLNAYIIHKMDSYLKKVEQHLAEVLPRARLFVTRSNGGATTCTDARRSPVYTLLSGPAAGVTAAQSLASQYPSRKFLTFDMGGTSSDISLIVDGLPLTSDESVVGEFPMVLPVTGVDAIGAGGGSIARADSGVLRVGPESAGAHPGPACFGRGGSLPTVTDAYLVSGYLDPANFLRGEMPLDPLLAVSALEPIKQALGTDIERAAEACISVATSNMVASILPFLARHGVDNDELCLIAYGGNGGLQGALLASALGIGQVLVPKRSSVFAAFGGLVAELVHDTVDVVWGTQLTIDAVRRKYRDLEQSARSWLERQVPDNTSGLPVVVERWASMRYAGQSFDVAVMVSDDAIDREDLNALESAFHDEHARLYNHADRSAGVNVVELRVRIRAGLPSVDRSHEPGGEPGLAPSATRKRTIHIGGLQHKDTPVYNWGDLTAGQVLTGPALVEDVDTTVLVPAEFVARLQPNGDILLTGGED